MDLTRTKFRALILACICAIFASCATSNRVTLPSGETGYTINCDGSMVNMNVCFEEAGNLCPEGYELLNQSQNGGWIATNTFAGSTSTKGIMVKCKGQIRKKDHIPEEKVEITEENIGTYKETIADAYEILKDELSNEYQRTRAKHAIQIYEPQVNIYLATIKPDNGKGQVVQQVKQPQEISNMSSVVTSQNDANNDSLWEARFTANNQVPVKYKGKFEALQECKDWGVAKSNGFRDKAFSFSFECSRNGESIKQKVW
jgi:hypothetical protein